MNIRSATYEDIPSMVKNGRVFVESTAYRDIGYCEDSMALAFRQMIDDGLCVIAEVNGEHLGGVGAVKGSIFINNAVTVANERFWWVLPDERAAGVGKALLMALHHFAKKASCDYLLMIALHNDELMQVDAAYSKAGFVPSEHIYLKRL